MDGEIAAALCRALAAQADVLVGSYALQDAKLPVVEKEAALRAALDASPGRFLARFGRLLSDAQLAVFETGAVISEETVVLRELRRQRALERNPKAIRNRFGGERIQIESMPN